MKKFAVAVCLLMMSAAAFGQEKKAAGAGNSAAVGTWKCDAAVSKNPWFKSATLKIVKDTDDEIAWRMQGVGADGKPFHSSITAKKGGDPAPVVGRKGQTIQYKKDASDFVVKDADGRQAVLHSSISEDGNTFTVDGKSEKDGKSEDVHDVWRRAGKKAKS